MRDPEEPMKNRLRASELLGRSCGDFLERVQVDTVEVPAIHVIFGDSVEEVV